MLAETLNCFLPSHLEKERKPLQCSDFLPVASGAGSKSQCCVESVVVPPPVPGVVVSGAKVILGQLHEWIPSNHLLSFFLKKKLFKRRGKKKKKVNLSVHLYVVQRTRWILPLYFSRHLFILYVLDPGAG